MSGRKQQLLQLKGPLHITQAQTYTFYPIKIGALTGNARTNTRKAHTHTHTPTHQLGGNCSLDGTLAALRSSELMDRKAETGREGWGKGKGRESIAEHREPKRTVHNNRTAAAADAKSETRQRQRFYFFTHCGSGRSPCQTGSQLSSAKPPQLGKKERKSGCFAQRSVQERDSAEHTLKSARQR